MADGNRLVVGHLVGVYGVRGWLKVKSFTEDDDNILRYQPWYLRLSNGVSRVEVEDYEFRPKGILVKFRNIDDRDQAQALGKAQIEVDAANLPPLEAGEYYWNQLIGLAVISEYEGQRLLLGSVRELLETGSNDVLVVQGDDHSIDQRERLIPSLPGEFVKAVDLEQKQILVDWDPEF